MSPAESQSAAAVLMVRPACFGFNAETAESNAFQHRPSPAAAPAAPRTAALAEFDTVVSALRRAGVEVIVAEDTPDPPKPDAVFPNNWVSFHRDGRVVFYPMQAPSRRAERREALIAELVRTHGFSIYGTEDLSYREAEGKFLEGTGSLVLDRAARVAYACLSPRTDLDVLGEFAQRLGYEPVAFEAVDRQGRPIYHTNVLMAVGSEFAVVCAEAIPDPRQRAGVLSRLAATGHGVVEITHAQMASFAGNCLELSPPQGRLVVMSEAAWTSLRDGQREALQRQGAVLRVAIPTIERVGGGGIRCMLAEVHLPRRD
ncbi:MAG: amidinotransferase [Gammaproteobacteria bacterium]|nr:amidinotransferase [Gammaproteobacteria bacterium]